MIIENAPVFNAAGSGLAASFAVNFTADLSHTLLIDGTWQGDKKRAASLYIDNYNNNFALTITVGVSTVRCPAYSQGYITVSSADRVIIVGDGAATVSMTLYTETKPDGFTARGNPPASDLANADTLALFHMDGFDGQTVTYDAKVRAVFTGFQSANLDATIKKFGASSGQLISGNGTYFITTATYSFTKGFTLEGWFYLTAINGTSQPTIILECANIQLRYGVLGAIELFDKGTSASIVTASIPALNTWYHIAACGMNGRAQVYRDGLVIGPSAAFVISTVTGAIKIGTTHPGQQQVHFFYCDEIRVTNNALYFEAFTPPAVPFTG